MAAFKGTSRISIAITSKIISTISMDRMYIRLFLKRK
jgi:hypothetical protein